MFRINRRLLAVTAFAALALATIGSVAAYEVYTNPSYQGCTTQGYALSWINSGDHIYNENDENGSCATRVAAKAWYQHPTSGWLETSWHISTTVAYAEWHYVNASPYTKGSYQVEVGTDDWSGITYSALLTPD